jgi:SAM-dependent methyltransferase
VNRRLVALTGLHKGQCVVDLGAGTGAVTKLLAEQVASRPTSEVIAVEPSEPAIEVARGTGELHRAAVRFVQEARRSYRNSSKPRRCHLLLQRHSPGLREGPRPAGDPQDVARRGDVLLNTSFYNGAEPPSPSSSTAVDDARLARPRPTTAARQDQGGSRIRLTADDYLRLLEENGFTVRSKEVMTADMPLSGFEAISDTAYD